MLKVCNRCLANQYFNFIKTIHPIMTSPTTYIYLPSPQLSIL